MEQINKDKQKKSINLFLLVLIVFLLTLAGAWFLFSATPFAAAFMGHNTQFSHYMAMKDNIMHHNIAKGDYACCVEKPCTDCIEKTPWHGEETSCHCLDDLVNGVSPCGECIGEILQGRGNKYLSKYFAESIAEEVGYEHKETLQQIIQDKYDKPKKEQ